MKAARLRAVLARVACRVAVLLAATLLAPKPALAHPGHGEHLSRGQAVMLLSGSALVLAGVLLMGARRRWIPVALLTVGLLSSSVGVLAVPLAQGPCRGRPQTTARLEVLAPPDGAAFSGRVPVRVRLIGGRLAPSAALANQPNEGHLHVTVDGQVSSMVGTESQDLQVPLGAHLITVEFVANDHLAYCPAVTVARRVVVTNTP